MAEDRRMAELDEYRQLMLPPQEYYDGFDIKTVLGAVFIAFVMLPGSIYLSLVAGVGMGEAAKWVTVILFVEVARRSFVTLRQQEIYLLVYIAAALIGTTPFQGFIWNAYLRTSQMTQGLGVAKDIPVWFVPPETSPGIIHRTFFHPDWWLAKDPVLGLLPGPVLIMLFGAIFGRIKGFTAGYMLFRLTSDYERLPFPIAPIGAQGALALAEVSRKEETWRWRMFSIGAMIGLAFGMFYVGIPTLTGAVMSKPLQLIKIPFIDLTHNTEHVLPATPTGIGTDIGSVGWGMVMPFYAVLGSFLASMMTLILNPILYHKGFLQKWHPGMDSIQTSIMNTYDFWLSAHVGVVFAIAVIGIGSVITSLFKRRSASLGATESGLEKPSYRGSWTPPPGRGDFPILLMLFLYVITSLSYVWLCHKLIPAFPVLFLLAFPFLYTPLASYIDVRMRAMVGQWVTIPYFREATLIGFSRVKKYEGIDIWFAPIPIADYAGTAEHFRVVELTGTKFTSMVKAEVLVVCIGLTASLIISQFIWRLSPIPSYAYPFAQKMWPLQAFNQSLWWTATKTGRQQLLEAFKLPIASGAFVAALVSYGALYALHLPIMLVYGFIRGMGNWPHYAILEMVGACIGRFYFMKRIEPNTWRRYATVLMAGYACGMGLIGMCCAAIALISKAVSQLPY